MFLDRRRCGVLLHPTSLPGPHGVGDLGPSAYHFIDWLHTGAQGLWQVLPLTPVGAANSPYAGLSAFAGSPRLVALEPLAERGWLTREELRPPPFDPLRTDFDRSRRFRLRRLARAAERFFAGARGEVRDRFDAFCTAQAHWLDDYALFMALDTAYRVKRIHDWTHWDAPLARREPAALAAAAAAHAEAMAFRRFTQWCFEEQWQALARYARARDIKIVGDLPLYVAHHSADCWAQPQAFRLDARGLPAAVAGVPPDYFSATGQRWGNPLYDWERLRSDGYRWWIARLRRALAHFDALRLDHVRGLAAYWEIPAASSTAIDGRWVEAPGRELLATLRGALGELPLIAEDLGVITPDVEALRDDFALPGMRVLQFAFGSDGRHPFLPHNYVDNCVAYTGTHDNDTSRGWYLAAPEHERAHAREYLRSDGADIAWDMIRAACGSVARWAVYPMQDVLALGSAHRMNIPGQTGCWTWRFGWDQVGDAPARRLAELAQLYGRLA
ncbi:MAG: 4-alpha-glucanotransferase [Betaproteobacteria bacterium]